MPKNGKKFAAAVAQVTVGGAGVDAEEVLRLAVVAVAQPDVLVAVAVNVHHRAAAAVELAPAA